MVDIFGQARGQAKPWYRDESSSNKSVLVTCDRGHSLARVLWFISFSSSLRAFLTVAWFQCSHGMSSSLAKLPEQRKHTLLHSTFVFESEPQRH